MTASAERIKLVVLSSPTFDADAFEASLASEGLSWKRSPEATQAEELIEVAGRICYMSFGPNNQSPRSNAEYIRNLIDKGHESVLEHPVWTFLLKGVSRSFSHQMVRHRVGFAFSQLSQQYADQSQMPARIPEALRQSDRLQSLWSAAVESSRIAYREILVELDKQGDVPGGVNIPGERRRAIRTAARSVLPEATETRLIFSANARALRYFLKTRGGIVGDEEMRLVAGAVLSVIAKEAPTVFSDFETVEVGGLPLVRFLGNEG